MTALLAAVRHTQPAIIRADTRALPLADGSVDLIVTSPPYWALRSYQDGGEHYAGQIGAEATPAEYIDALIECTREWMRVLKPSGSAFVNLGDKYNWEGFPGVPQGSLWLLPERYRIRCIDELGLIARALIIWDKPSSAPDVAPDRVRRTHEDWVHLVRSRVYFADLDSVREPYDGKPQRRFSPRIADRQSDGRPRGMDATVWTEPKAGANLLGKVPDSGWRIPTQYVVAPTSIDVTHFAAFPMEWPRQLIKGWCPPSGVVLDPLGGTGTTALVASMLGRTGITVDASADYCRLAQWRCSDPGERAKAAQVDKPPVEAPGQVDLFGAVS